MKFAPLFLSASLFLSTSVAFANDAIISEGLVHSAPPKGFLDSSISRLTVTEGLPEVVRSNVADTLASEGRKAIQSNTASIRSRADVQREAEAMVRENIRDPLAAAGERMFGLPQRPEASTQVGRR